MSLRLFRLRFVLKAAVCRPLRVFGLISYAWVRGAATVHGTSELGLFKK